MSKLTYIITHGSDSTFGCASIIRRWHLQRGFRDVGYNLIIPNGHIIKHDFYLPQLDGSLEVGRVFNGNHLIDTNEQGAHALGYNGKSLGVCLIGKKGQYTSAQINTFIQVLISLINQFQIPVDNILGHYETKSGRAQGKTCPDLDMRLFRRTLRERLVG